MLEEGGIPACWRRISRTGFLRSNWALKNFVDALN
jgi:hypothetical protein